MNKHNQEPLYSISIVSRLTGLSPRILRSYEEAGLIEPYRSRGNTRIYSNADLKKIRLICYLQREKEVNLSGIRVIFEIMTENKLSLQMIIKNLREELNWENEE